MGISKASGQWEGGLKDGKGEMTPAHASAVPFSLGTRFEGKQGSNPEEMVGAALAGCFSMAFSVTLEKAGLKPQLIRSSTDVHLDKQGEGFAITTIDLSTEVTVAGVDDAKFQQLAEETKKNCPVSKALGGVQINLKAKLNAA